MGFIRIARSHLLPCALTLTLLASSAAAEPFLGEIRMFAGSFAPRGWALCDGQLLPIAQNSALFSILGTTYGGDGRTSFGLPDLRGRVPVHAGQGPGLSDRRLGRPFGTETNVLTGDQLPSHSHELKASEELASSTTPGNGTMLASKSRTKLYAENPGSEVSMSPRSITSTGGSQPVNNMQPSLGIHYIIALTGIFPSRN